MAMQLRSQANRVKLKWTLSTLQRLQFHGFHPFPSHSLLYHL